MFSFFFGGGFCFKRNKVCPKKKTHLGGPSHHFVVCVCVCAPIGYAQIGLGRVTRLSEQGWFREVGSQMVAIQTQ